MTPTPEPEPPARGAALTRVLDRAAGHYVALCRRRGAWVLGAMFALAGAGALMAPGIDVDPGLEALLPPSDARRNVLEAERRFANASPMYLVVQSGDVELNRRLSRQILEGARRWPDALWAIRRREPDYFLDRRLLFLPADELADLADQVEAVSSWETCRAQPLCVNVEDRPEEPDIEELRARYDRHPELSALLSLLGAKGSPSATAAQTESRAGGGELGELCARGGRVCVVQVVLDGNPSNLEYALSRLHRGEALLESLRPTDAPEDLRMEVTGRYRKIPRNVRAARKDLRDTGLLGLVLVLLVIVAQFRAPRALLLLAAPLVVGAAWTAGVIAVLSPTLSLISAAMLVVLVGLGVDFGLHLLTHYGSHRQSGLQPAEAIRRTLSSTGPSLAVAAITTGCGFAALMAADFRGFAQMGMVAAIGIALTFLATLLLFPPLVLGLHRLRPEPGPTLRGWRWPDRLSRRPGRMTLIAVVSAGPLLLLGGAWLSRDLALEEDFRNIQDDAVPHSTDFGEALHGTLAVTVLLMTDDPESLERAARALRERAERDPAQNVSLVLTPRSFIPPDQPARLAQLARLRTAVEGLERHANEEAREKIARWHRLLDVHEPITVDTLPPWVLQLFAERDGSFGRVGFLYSTERSSNATGMARLSGQIEEWSRSYPEVRFASPAALLGQINPGLRADAPLIVGLALLGLLLVTLLIGRSALRTATVTLPVLIASAATVGSVVLLGWKVNLYNILVFPLAFGIGVDGAVYVVWSVRRQPGDPYRWDRLAVSARAVIGSTMTSMAGFGALIASENPGLSSLGKLAVLALGCTLVLNLVWLPAVLALVERWRHPDRVSRSGPGRATWP